MYHSNKYNNDLGTYSTYSTYSTHTAHIGCGGDGLYLGDKLRISDCFEVSISLLLQALRVVGR